MATSSLLHHFIQINGYQSSEFNTWDALLPSPNHNCGGSVGIYISGHLTYTRLDLPNSFIPGVFESIGVKVKINKNEYRIIGNVYRPNTYPRANPTLHNRYLMDILSHISRSKELNKLKINLTRDFNLDLLKFSVHGPTDEFIYTVYSSGLIPTITKPTKIQGISVSLIDNIFTFSMGMGLSSILLNNLSDHNMIFAIEEISTGCPEGKVKKTRHVHQKH